ncbi:peptide cleavage/export ABC transporter [Enterococcus gallinarum]|nr:peptide cleavage/export ABC transporter [Enterococcus gallinarum]
MFKRKYPVIRQHDASDCAAAALATVCKHYKKEITIMKMREVIGTDSYGTSVHGLVTGAEKLGFEVKAIKIAFNRVTDEYTLPAIAQVITNEGLNHFVVINRFKKETFYISDPAKGIVEYSTKQFKKIFTGILVLLIPKSEFEIKRNKGVSMWQLFKQVMLPQKKLLLTVILTSFALTILGIFSSLFSKIIFDEIIPYQLKKTLFVYILVFGVIGFIQIFLSFFRSYVLLFLSRKIDLPVLLGYYNHVLKLPYQFFATRRIGDILTRFQDAMTIKDIFSQVSISLVLDVVLASFTGIVLFKLNVFLFGMILLVVMVNVVLIYTFKGRYKKINYEQMEAGSMMNSQLIESIQNIETIKAYTSEANQIEKLERRFVKVLKLDYSEGLLSNIQGAISSGIGNLSNLFLIGFGALSIIDGKLSIGDLMVFQTLSGYFISPIQNIVSLQLTYQEAQIAMTRLSELMDLNIEESSDSELLENISLKGDIRFTDVSFSYGSRPPILNQLTFTCKEGQRIAIVGESGAGKSTIAKLLLKFYELETGRIMLNGYTISDIKASTLRSKIGYVPQNIELFTGSIMENIRYGDETATYEQVIAAAKMAGCYDFIQKLPNRFYSFVEENGSNFSGGERQRIAIARSFLRKRELYIFDESTSNLDSFSEQYIQKAMIEATGSATTIIIAHRLSTIISSDWIIFMANGRIIEQGTHDELMDINGEYAKMVRLQLAGLKGDVSIELSSNEDSEQEEIDYL